MKVQLLVSEWCEPCDKAEETWRRVAEEREIQFEVLDMAQPEGREVARRLGIRTIPSVVIDEVTILLGARAVMSLGATLAWGALLLFTLRIPPVLWSRP